MPRERMPRHPVDRSYQPPGTVRYRVQDGDSWVSLAKRFGLKDGWSLVELNFKTRSPAEVNWYLRHHVGCVLQTRDGQNWVFSAAADPGIIFVPRPKEHRTVGRGEYVMGEDDNLFNVAWDHGHVWKTIWEHPENAEVRKVRERPEAIMPGDRIHIPPVRPRTLDCGTAAVHPFRRLGKQQELGTLVVHTDLRDGEVADARDVFVLSGSSGYRATRGAQDDHVLGDAGISLIFVGMPLGHTYTLTVTLADGEEITLFADVPFDDLHRQSMDLEPHVREPW